MILLIALIMGTFSMAFAVDWNPVVQDMGNFTTQVISPLAFTVMTGQNENTPLEVVVGTRRELTTDNRVYLFGMSKEPGKFAMLSMQCDANKENVHLEATWLWFDTPPNWGPGPLPAGYGTVVDPAFPMGWEDTAPYQTTTTGWLAIVITAIDARATTAVGPRVFTAHVSGYYRDL